MSRQAAHCGGTRYTLGHSRRTDRVNASIQGAGFATDRDRRPGRGRRSRRSPASSRRGSVSSASTPVRCTAPSPWWRCERGVVDDPEALAEIARTIDLEVSDRIEVDGVDVTEAIRSPEVDAAVSGVSAHAPVRAALVERQRAWVRGAWRRGRRGTRHRDCRRCQRRFEGLPHRPPRRPRRAGVPASVRPPTGRATLPQCAPRSTPATGSTRRGRFRLSFRPRTRWSSTRVSGPSTRSSTRSSAVCRPLPRARTRRRVATGAADLLAGALVLRRLPRPHRRAVADPAAGEGDRPGERPAPGGVHLRPAAPLRHRLPDRRPHHPPAAALHRQGRDLRQPTLLLADRDARGLPGAPRHRPIGRPSTARSRCCAPANLSCCFPRGPATSGPRLARCSRVPPTWRCAPGCRSSRSDWPGPSAGCRSGRGSIHPGRIAIVVGEPLMAGVERAAAGQGRVPRSAVHALTEELVGAIQEASDEASLLLSRK